MLCRLIALVEPGAFKELELTNLPQDLNISISDPDESLDKFLDSEARKLTGDKSNNAHDVLSSTGGVGVVSEAYRSLTIKEEEDIEQFLDELGGGVKSRNAAALTEILEQQLARFEGTNIHSIMGSEDKVLKLMGTLDTAIDRAEKLEAQLESYYQYLNEVEDAMTSLQDHDLLVQTTINNRGSFLQTLENLVHYLDLDPKYVRALMDADLKDYAGKKLCTEAAKHLDGVLNVETKEGLEHLSAVQERMKEFRNLRDSFAVKLTRHVSDTIVMFSSQLTLALNSGIGLSSGSDKSSLLTSLFNDSSGSLGRSQSLLGPTTFNYSTQIYATQRSALLQLAELIGQWLKVNRSDLLIELKRMYVQKIQFMFKRQIQELLNATHNTILNLVRPGKSSHNSKTAGDNISIDSGSAMNLFNLGNNILTQVDNIFDECLSKILALIHGEQAFLIHFFGFKLKEEGTTRPFNASLSIQNDDLSSLNHYLQRLFDGIEAETSNLIGTCEQTLATLIMPMMVVSDRLARQLRLSSFLNYFEIDDLDLDLIGGGVDATKQGASTTSVKKAKDKSTDISAEVLAQSFGAQFMAKLIGVTKQAFDRHIQRMISIFRQSKLPKKTRCGTLNMIRTYVEFAECAVAVFEQSDQKSYLERANIDLLFELMNNIERVSTESVKAPSEVIRMENYHCLQDVLRRLKMSGLNDHLKEAKNRYNMALDEFTKNCMGRPLEKLASFFENVQSALDAGVRPEAISYQFAFSKQELRKVIKEYPGKEVKRGLENLCKKVEKYISEENNLFPVVWYSIQTEFISQCVRFNQLIEECYPDSQISLEFTIADLQNYFQELARIR